MEREGLKSDLHANGPRRADGGLMETDHAGSAALTEADSLNTQVKS